MKDGNPPQRKRRWPVFIGGAVLLWAGLVLVFDFFPEEEKEIRREFRNTVEKAFPGEAAKVADSFGLTYHSEGSSESLNPAAPSVVLIHGLDEPGKVWMNLAPALTDKKINVWEMRYPNDQPVEDSARLFHEEVKRLNPLGIDRIAIVAHSMGGLVSREMLTNPQIAYPHEADTGEVPRVTGLIMVGTPNHGSELARFRVFAEIRDQWINMARGQGHILGAILDGAGEAKIDLLPGSRFLTALNERPQPEGVDMLIIAGVISPWTDTDIERFLGSTRENTPAAGQELLESLGVFVNSMGDGLGDGLVTVESTRIEGVDHRTVAGTHLSMIRNISKDSDRVPPSVPLITERLEGILSKD